MFETIFDTDCGQGTLEDQETQGSRKVQELDFFDQDATFCCQTGCIDL